MKPQNGLLMEPLKCILPHIIDVICKLFVGKPYISCDFCIKKRKFI